MPIKDKISKMSDAISDMIGVPRHGEDMVDMHNRMTNDFNDQHKIEPGDKQTADTMRKKQGPGMWQGEVE